MANDLEAIRRDLRLHNALCVIKPMRILEIKNLAKWVPLLPFSWAWIVSDKKYLTTGPPLIVWPGVLLCDRSDLRNPIWAWRATAIKFSFSRFFLSNTWFLIVESFKIIWPALPVFWPKTPKKIIFFTWKVICSKILVIFHLFKNEPPVFI